MGFAARQRGGRFSRVSIGVGARVVFYASGGRQEGEVLCDMGNCLEVRDQSGETFFYSPAALALWNVRGGR